MKFEWLSRWLSSSPSSPFKRSGLKLLKMWNAQLPPLRRKEADGVHMVSPLSSFHIVLLAIAASKDWQPEMTLQDTCCLPFSLLSLLWLLLLVLLCCCCWCCCYSCCCWWFCRHMQLASKPSLPTSLSLGIFTLKLSFFSISAANPTSVPLSCHMGVKHIEKLCAKVLIHCHFHSCHAYSRAPIRDLGEVVFQGYKRIYPCWIGFTW